MDFKGQQTWLLSPVQFPLHRVLGLNGPSACSGGSSSSTQETLIGPVPQGQTFGSQGRRGPVTRTHGGASRRARVCCISEVVRQHVLEEWKAGVRRPGVWWPTPSPRMNAAPSGSREAPTAPEDRNCGSEDNKPQQGPSVTDHGLSSMPSPHRASAGTHADGISPPSLGRDSCGQRYPTRSMVLGDFFPEPSKSPSGKRVFHVVTSPSWCHRRHGSEPSGGPRRSPGMMKLGGLERSGDSRSHGATTRRAISRVPAPARP
ncbi:uncharacterized protein LOC105242076 [Ailuropoda melanoleuca]|uniref:uncharacterized protein LOC105242076 n=1 Tax=Ailuropoda melanoleuca TaxID=9646 RepID=UPI00149400A2|nr:uncharacterized protein LOC105242076 [Ailuropoda melanoleuca]